MATSPRRPVVRRSLYGGLTTPRPPPLYLYPTPLTGATVKSPSAVSVVICIPEVDGNIGAHFLPVVEMLTATVGGFFYLHRIAKESSAVEFVGRNSYILPKIHPFLAQRQSANEQRNEGGNPSLSSGHLSIYLTQQVQELSHYNTQIYNFISLNRLATIYPRRL